MKDNLFVGGLAAVLVVFFLSVAAVRVINRSSPNIVQETIQFNTSSAQVPAATIGTTWDSIINLTNGGLGNPKIQANGFQVATDASKRVHVVYPNDKGEIYYKRFNGTAWEAPKKLSDIAANVNLGMLQELNVGGPVVSANSSGVHVVWNYAVVNASGNPIGERKIYYQRSTDGGATFSTPVLIGTGGDNFGGATICSVVTTTGGKLVNILSTDTTLRKLVSYFSNNNGTTFTQYTVAGYDSAKEAPVCAIGPGGVSYVVWQDDRDGIVVNGLKRRDVHFSRSLNGGRAWEEAKNISKTPGVGSSDQSIAVGPNGKVHVVYHDDKNDGNNSWEIYYVGSSDYGVTWGIPQKLTTTALISGVNIDIPTVTATMDGSVYIVWQDNRSGIFQTFFKRGNGVSWQPETAISGDIRASFDPSIAKSSDELSLYVVWSGVGPAGGRDMFYRRLR